MLPPETVKLLVDIAQAQEDIRSFTAGMDYQAYRSNRMCRAAVERKFEVVGEACTRLRDRYPELFARIAPAPQIIGFQNRLIHGYDNIDDAIVWDVVTSKLPALEAEVREMMAY